MAKWTFPYGVEGYEHSFWNDVNDDGVVEPGTEIVAKRNIEQVSGDSAVALYDLFTGASSNASRSDSSWFSPWLRHVTATLYNGDREEALETARYIAAQTAANIADAADSDTVPQSYYLKPANNELTNVPGAYDRRIIGTENVHMFAAASLNLFVAYDAAGRDLTITPQASVAVYNPFGTDAFDGEITLEYSFSILSGPTGTNIPTTVPGTVTVDASSMTSTTLAGGDYSASNVSILGSDVFAPAAPPRDGSYTLNQLVIKSVTVTDGGSVVYDVAPDNQVAVVSTDSLYNWAPGYTHIDGSDYSHYTGISVQAVEPRFNGLNEQHSYAGTYLTTQTAAIVDSALGLPEPPADPPPPLQRHPWDVSAGGDDYDGSEVRDAAFTKLEQLGAVTSGWYYNGLPGSHPIGRSLQFWCRTDDASATHDGQLLDLFYDGEELEYGKVNVNSPHVAVWEGLLSGVSPSPSQMAETLVNMTDTAPYAGVGEIVQFNNLFLSTLPDSVAEQTNLATIRPLLSVKNQYFTVSATAQSLRDRGAVDISSDADQVEWGTGLFALITGEQKVLAVIYRNLFTNELEVIRYEPLYD